MMRWEFIFGIGVAAGFIWASLIWFGVALSRAASKELPKR